MLVFLFFKPQMHFLLSITNLNFLYIPRSPGIFLLEQLKKIIFWFVISFLIDHYPTNSECRAEKKLAFVIFFLLKQSELEKHWKLQLFKRDRNEFIFYLILLKQRICITSTSELTITLRGQFHFKVLKMTYILYFVSETLNSLLLWRQTMRSISQSISLPSAFVAAQYTTHYEQITTKQTNHITTDECLQLGLQLIS